MKQKGFTLIELLAVIVILAVIALIATPLVLNSVNDAKDGALKATARTIIEEAEKTYVQKLRNDPLSVPTVLPSEVKYSGEQIEEGNLKLSFNDMGLVNIAIYKDAKCVYKQASDKDVTLEKNISLAECKAKISSGAELLVYKANGADATYNNGNTGEMFVFSHEATEQTPAITDYRYIGNVPNNYITFNNETWRIVGVFDGRIKIIREEKIENTDLYWDYKQNGVGSSTSTTVPGSNDWSDSQLMYMLNPTTYTLKSGYRLDGNYIKDTNGNIIYQTGCLPASIASGATSYSCTAHTWSLNSTALSQIDTVTYYLGGLTSPHGQTAESYYSEERSNSVSSGRPTTWTGQVGLMYPSDYGYTFAKGVNDKCYNNLYQCSSETPSASWLYKSGYKQWTLLSFSGDAYRVFYVDSYGGVYGNGASYTFGVYPVVYLKPEIKLTGTGTSTNPYQISN